MNLGLMIALVAVNSVMLVAALTFGIWQIKTLRRLAHNSHKKAEEAEKIALTLLEVSAAPRDHTLPYHQDARRDVLKRADIL